MGKTAMLISPRRSRSIRSVKPKWSFPKAPKRSFPKTPIEVGLVPSSARSHGRALLFWQRFGPKAERISPKDFVDVFCLVTASGQDFFELVDVGDGVEIARGLFCAEATVEVGAEATVVR